MNLVESHSHDVERIRVFSLTVALILLTYSAAGFQMQAPANVTPLGIPLTIRRPELLPIALVVSAIYSTMRYVYFGMLVQPSPIRARKRLMSGSRADTTTTPAGLDALHAQVSEEVHRYFPRFGKKRVVFEITEIGDTLRLKVDVPLTIRLISRFEDLDFLAPIWANALAIASWLYFLAR
jgi:hypothetical protein